MSTDVIGIPYGIRLQAIVLHDDEVHIWIATKSRGADYSKWQGTYIRVEHSGRVTRITIDDAVPEEPAFVIKE